MGLLDVVGAMMGKTNIIPGITFIDKGTDFSLIEYDGGVFNWNTVPGFESIVFAQGENGILSRGGSEFYYNKEDGTAIIANPGRMPMERDAMFKYLEKHYNTKNFVTIDSDNCDSVEFRKLLPIAKNIEIIAHMVKNHALVVMPRQTISLLSYVNLSEAPDNTMFKLVDIDYLVFDILDRSVLDLKWLDKTVLSKIRMNNINSL